MKAFFYYCINSNDVKKVEIQVPNNLKDNEDYTKDFKTKKKEEIDKKIILTIFQIIYLIFLI
jgi:hypothetical protein